MTPGRPRARATVLAAVLLIHGALLWHGPPAPPPHEARPPARVAVRLLAPPREPRAATPSAAPAAPVAGRVAPTRRRTTATAPMAAPSRADPSPEAPVRAAVGELAEAASPAASQPALLDTEATRQAIRQAARAPGLAAQAGRVGDPVRSADQRLGSGIQQGAKGDCLKGEYLGGGMGLLSLPFLAAAALREQCRR